MLLYKDYLTFKILEQDVNLVFSDTDYGYNTIVEIMDKYYYLGNSQPNIYTAILAWQKVFNRTLTEEEQRLVMMDNHITSSAI